MNVVGIQTGNRPEPTLARELVRHDLGLASDR